MRAVFEAEQEEQEEPVVEGTQVLRAPRVLSVPMADIQTALSGGMDALEGIFFTNTVLDQATCQFIHDQANIVVGGTERRALNPRLPGNQQTEVVKNTYHCALTLLGHIKMKAVLGQENGYSLAEGLACLEKAAKAENPWAMYLVGGCYRTGQGREIDKHKAQGYYLRALRRLSTKQRIKNDLIALLSNGGNTQPFRDYIDNMILASNLPPLKQAYGKEMRKLFVCITASTEDSLLSEEQKFEQCSVICPLGDIAQHNQDEDFIFSWGMMYAELAKRMVVSRNILKFEEARSLATQCFERLKALNPQHNHVAVLRDKLRDVSYQSIEQMNDFAHPQKGAAGLRALLEIATDPKGLFLLAKLVMQYDTDDVFINRKDKFRFILDCLGQIDIDDREQCEGYEPLLRATVANLLPENRADALEDFLIVKFDTIASVIAGFPMHFPANDGRLRYTQRMELEMVMDAETKVDGVVVPIEATPNRDKLIEHFGTTNVRSVEYLLCDSYSDNVGNLDVAYLQAQLCAKFKARIEKAAIPSGEVEISHSGHGLAMAIEREREQRAIKTEQTPRALALRAIEKAVPEYEAAKKQHDYRLMAWIKSGNDEARSEDAKKFFTACKLINNDVELMNAIVKHITQEKGRLNPTSFKSFLLRYLTEAFNLGNIQELETDPEIFRGRICTMLRMHNQSLGQLFAANLEIQALDFQAEQREDPTAPSIVADGGSQDNSTTVNNGMNL